MKSIAKEFIEESIFRIEKNTTNTIKSLGMLTEDQIWKWPNEVSNSAGNILLHLCGNTRQYLISALSDLPDIREKDEEFSAKAGYSKEELQLKLAATVEEAIDILRMVDEYWLMKIHSVQGF